MIQVKVSGEIEAICLEMEIAKVANAREDSACLKSGSGNYDGGIEIFPTYPEALRNGRLFNYGRTIRIKNRVGWNNVNFSYCETGFFIRRVGFGANVLGVFTGLYGIRALPKKRLWVISPERVGIFRETIT